MKLKKDPDLLFTRKKDHWKGLYICWFPDIEEFKYIKYKNGLEQITGNPSYNAKSYKDFVAVERNIIKRKAKIKKRNKENNRSEKMSVNKNYVGKFNVVGVHFEYLNKDYESGKKNPATIYYYKIDPSIQVKAGDPVVVDGIGPKVAVVCETFEDEFTQEVIEAKNKADTWIINRIDDTLHRKRMEATERQKYLKMEMQRIKDEFNEMQVLEAIAQSNPDAKKLLEEIKSIENFGD
jgi:hypothetical protein